MNTIEALLNKRSLNDKLHPLSNLHDVYRTVYESTMDPAFLLTLQGDFVIANKSAEKLFALNEHEIVNESILSFIEQKDLKKVSAMVGNISDNKILETTFSIKNKQEKVFEMNLIAVTYKDIDTNISYIVAVVEEIAEKKGTEEAFEQRLGNECFLNEHPDAVITLSKSHKVASCNRSFFKLSGYKNKESIKSFHGLFAQSHAEKVVTILTDIFSGGKAVEFNTVVIHKDGTEIEVHLTLIPVISKTGFEKVIAILKDSTKVTAYKKNLFKVKRSLIDAQKVANIGTWEYNINNKEGCWSKQLFRIFGMDEDTAEPPSFEEFLKMVHPDDTEKCEWAMARAIEYGESFSHLSRIIRQDGLERIVQVQAKPIFNELKKVHKLIGTYYDITNLQEVKEKLADKEKQVETIYNNLDETIWSIDIIAKKVLFCSQGFEEIYGYSLNQILEKKGFWLSLLHSDDKEKMLFAVQKLYRGERQMLQHRFIHPSGETRWINTKCFPTVDEKGDLIRLDGIMWDVTEDKSEEERIEYLAYYDYLTSLPNRRQFDEKIQNIVNNRDTVNPFAILFLDLDRFKHINDMLGNSIADKLLKEVSMRLRNCLPENHFLARMGGDEFSLLVYDSDEKTVIKIANDIRTQIRKPYLIDEFELHVTTSIGISIQPFESKSFGDTKSILKNAETALYHAKKLGRNTYQVYSPSMNISSYKMYYLEKDIRKALKSNEFFLEYQPKVVSKTGEMVGAEALIRWEHPERGRVSPGEFISIAEESDLICDIGEWVIERVCKQIHEWKADKIITVPISINISPQQLLKKNIIQTIKRSLEKYGIEPSMLELEITENSLIQSPEVVFSTISMLKEIGIKLSLDDFGVGFSSLTHLKKFDLDILKIDKSFIDSIPHKTEDAIIISSLIQMAHGLGLKVVAEGVESEKQLTFLQKKDCDFIQGFLFSRPVRVEEFIGLLHKKIIYLPYS